MRKISRFGACVLTLSVLAIGDLRAAANADKAAPDKTSEKTLTATGTIAKLQATEHRLTLSVSGAPQAFVWTPQTRINGTLSQGAKVTVRYSVLSDGQSVAQQISVLK